jgi:hypothetical protein
MRLTYLIAHTKKQKSYFVGSKNEILSVVYNNTI